MFISVLELFKIGIGPSSSHTVGPMVAAKLFMKQVEQYNFTDNDSKHLSLTCKLKGSLAFTGKGHATDKAVTLGLHGYSAIDLAQLKNIDHLIDELWQKTSLPNLPRLSNTSIAFSPSDNIIFDRGQALNEHPNGMIFTLADKDKNVLLTETYFSIGGGFISTLADIKHINAPLKMQAMDSCPYPFDSADSMLRMSADHNLSINEMKHVNECQYITELALQNGIDAIWSAMQNCIETGLHSAGTLPGGLHIKRRAKKLHQQLLDDPNANVNDWLCAYAMAVNEENAAGHMVVTAPTNGAAGVIPAVLYYFIKHENGTRKQLNNFLLTASAIGGLIKHNSSISGAEVGCQGEVGSAAAMAAAGLCAVRGGTTQQIENAAEIALEHHLGMTCDPVKGLVQVPCIERNGFGAIKAYAAASLAIRENGEHFMSLDNCIAAMKQTGLEMSDKYKET